MEARAMAVSSSAREWYIQRRAACVKALAERLRAAQENCEHRRVAHFSGVSAYSVAEPRRICLDCGIEEIGGWWCCRADCEFWHVRNYERLVPRLSNMGGRTVTEV